MQQIILCILWYGTFFKDSFQNNNGPYWDCRISLVDCFYSVNVASGFTIEDRSITLNHARADHVIGNCENYTRTPKSSVFVQSAIDILFLFRWLGKTRANGLQRREAGAGYGNEASGTGNSPERITECMDFFSASPRDSRVISLEVREKKSRKEIWVFPAQQLCFLFALGRNDNVDDS